MTKDTKILIKVIIIFILPFFCKDIFCMAGHPKYKPYVAKNGITYLSEQIKWASYGWYRMRYLKIFSDIEISDDNVAWESFGLGDIWPPPIYERKDLMEYISEYNEKTGEPVYQTYWRKPQNDIIVTDKPLNRPYVRLGTFATGGAAPPPNLRKSKGEIKNTAFCCFGSDAVIVEGYEIKKFRQEDFLPITEFESPEYVLYHCVAVAFKENAEIPGYVKVLVSSDKVFSFPYEKISDFKIEIPIKEAWKQVKIAKQVAYEKYHADGVIIYTNQEVIVPSSLFNKGKASLNCVAVKFTGKVQKQFLKLNKPNADNKETP